MTTTALIDPEWLAATRNRLLLLALLRANEPQALRGLGELSERVRRARG